MRISFVYNYKRLEKLFSLQSAQILLTVAQFSALKCLLSVNINIYARPLASTESTTPARKSRMRFTTVATRRSRHVAWIPKIDEILGPQWKAIETSPASQAELWNREMNVILLPQSKTIATWSFVTNHLDQDLKKQNAMMTLWKQNEPLSNNAHVNNKIISTIVSAHKHY